MAWWKRYWQWVVAGAVGLGAAFIAFLTLIGSVVKPPPLPPRPTTKPVDVPPPTAIVDPQPATSYEEGKPPPATDVAADINARYR